VQLVGSHYMDKSQCRPTKHSICCDLYYYDYSNSPDYDNYL